MKKLRIEDPGLPGLSIEDRKQLLRAQVRDIRGRRTVLPRERELHEQHALEAAGDAKAVAAFVSVNDEPSTRNLIVRLWEDGARVLLPSLGPGLTRQWAQFSGLDNLRVRAPGRPPEPTEPPLPPESLAQVDFIIAPALAVDETGVRLGQGGGWYDRMLALAPDTPVFTMVYDHELVDFALPTQTHDVRVDGVITPSFWRMF